MVVHAGRLVRVGVNRDRNSPSSVGDRLRLGSERVADILDDLKGWLAQLVQDAPHRKKRGELPEIDINYVKRAIEEIERLRAQAKPTD